MVNGNTTHTPVPTALQGWVCPKCQSVYSPQVKTCPKCSKQNVNEQLLTEDGYKWE